MSWETPFVIVRVGENATTSVVFSAESLKEAKYWIQYIAQPGDAIFQTPAHPKCAGKSDLTYYAHLVARGSIAYDEGKWRETFYKTPGPITASAPPT